MFGTPNFGNDNGRALGNNSLKKRLLKQLSIKKTNSPSNFEKEEKDKPSSLFRTKRKPLKSKLKAAPGVGGNYKRRFGIFPLEDTCAADAKIKQRKNTLIGGKLEEAKLNGIQQELKKDLLKIDINEVEEVLSGNKGIETIGLEKFSEIDFTKSSKGAQNIVKAKRIWNNMFKYATGAQKDGCINSFIHEQQVKKEIDKLVSEALVQNLLLKNHNIFKAYMIEKYLDPNLKMSRGSTFQNRKVMIIQKMINDKNIFDEIKQKYQEEAAERKFSIKQENTFRFNPKKAELFDTNIQAMKTFIETEAPGDSPKGRNANDLMKRRTGFKINLSKVENPNMTIDPIPFKEMDKEDEEWSEDSDQAGSTKATASKQLDTHFGFPEMNRCMSPTPRIYGGSSPLAQNDLTRAPRPSFITRMNTLISKKKKSMTNLRRVKSPVLGLDKVNEDQRNLVSPTNLRRGCFSPTVGFYKQKSNNNSSRRSKKNLTVVLRNKACKSSFQKQGLKCPKINKTKLGGFKLKKLISPKKGKKGWL